GRLSGVLLPLFSLRSRGDFGIGDFGSLDGLFDWMAAAKQRLLMLLPLLPTAPGDSSPYSTRSAFGLNGLFIDLQALPEFIDAVSLCTAISADQQQRPWWEWPAGLRDRDPKAIAAEKSRLAREVMFHAWLQWVAETQWEKVRARARAKGILLCGDEPFIIGQDSSDTWSNPRILKRDARLGVPPDDFSATGQDWGLPYFDFAEMEKDGYAWLRFRARKAASYYDVRRVDHAVGYFRQWIRDEKNPVG